MLLSQSSETNLLETDLGVPSGIGNHDKSNIMCPACQIKPPAIAITVKFLATLQFIFIQ
jgi:hypothetical protein